MKRKLFKVKVVRRLIQLVRLMNVYFRTQDAGRESKKGDCGGKKSDF